MIKNKRVCAVFLYPGESRTEWKMKELLQAKAANVCLHQDKIHYSKIK
jgi:hypothetical protein